jgi:hypothetical protein
MLVAATVSTGTLTSLHTLFFKIVRSNWIKSSSVYYERKIRLSCNWYSSYICRYLCLIKSYHSYVGAIYCFFDSIVSCLMCTSFILKFAIAVVHHCFSYYKWCCAPFILGEISKLIFIVKNKSYFAGSFEPLSVCGLTSMFYCYIQEALFVGMKGIIDFDLQYEVKKLRSV